MSDAKPLRDLKTLRDALSQKDTELVQIIAERMTLIREVGQYKAAQGLPSFDREREGALLDTVLAKGEAAGLSAELIRDIFASLFEASRLDQRRFFQKQKQKDADHFTVGIIGGTAGMGGFMAKVLRESGFEVEVMGLDEGRSAEDVAASNDLVVLAVPIAETVTMARLLGPRVKQGGCLMDVTSLKQKPLAAMLESAPEGVDVVGTHPMFGPHGVDFDRQKVVLCRGRGDAWFDRIKKMYEAFGAETLEATAEEHDKQMAIIQVLVHEKTMVLGSTLERLGANLMRTLQFASPIYRTELALIGRLYSQRAELYADILTANENAFQPSHLFEQEAGHFARAVAMGDRETVIRRFHQVADYMKEFATWGKTQSDAILDELVRRG